MAHKGTSSFIMQRTSAVILLPLAIWFFWSLARHAGQDYEAARAWLKAPHNFVLFGAFVTVGALHGRIGVGEVIEDYIHGPFHGLVQFLNWAVALIVVAATWFALLSL